MLQQTRVEAVIGHWTRFLQTFPSVESLALATEDEVLARWSGLGYYRRARMLHAGARHVAEVHGGEVPRTREELARVPGVGAYTAGAIASIAFGQPEPAVDANVRRVVSRLLASVEAAGIEAFARDLVEGPRPGDVNEALMDLGSSLCTARRADCGPCPLRTGCAAFASGDPLAFPPRRVRKPPREVRLLCAVVRRGEAVLFVRRDSSDPLLGGLWDLPTVEVPAAAEGADGRANAGHEEEAFARVLRGLGLPAGLDVEHAGEVRHDIVGRRITASVGVVRVDARQECAAPASAWIVEEEMAGYGLPALPVRILRALGRNSRGGSRAVRGAARR